MGLEARNLPRPPNLNPRDINPSPPAGDPVNSPVSPESAETSDLSSAPVQDMNGGGRREQNEAIPPGSLAEILRTQGGSGAIRPEDHPALCRPGEGERGPYGSPNAPQTT